MDTAELACAIDTLARLQEGRVARWQLVGLGIRPATATRVPERHGWFSEAGGISRLPGWPQDEIGTMWTAVLSAAARHHRQDVAAVPCTAEELHARACHAFGLTAFSAAWLHGIAKHAPTRPQLLLPHPVRRRVQMIHPIRTRRPVVDLHLVRGLPVVPPVRMLWDCAMVLDRTDANPSQMFRLATRADGQRLIRARDLHLVVQDPAAAGMPRTVPTSFKVAAIGLADGHSHSSAEATGRRIIREVAESLGLAATTRPLAIPDEDSPVAEADIAIPLIKLDLEIDGPHHDEPDQQRHDRWRDEQLLKIGWTVRRYRTALVVEDPERFRRLVRADITQAAAAAGVRLTANA